VIDEKARPLVIEDYILSAKRIKLSLDEFSAFSSLPIELTNIILLFATYTKRNRTGAVTCIICRFVCRQWKVLLPHRRGVAKEGDQISASMGKAKCLSMACKGLCKGS